MTLQSGNISLELLNLDDLMKISNKEILLNTTKEQIVAIDKKIIKMKQADVSEYPWLSYWMIKCEDVSCGLIGFKGIRSDRTVEIGYGIFKEFQSRGLMSRAIKVLTDWALDQKPGLVITATNVLKTNKGSQRVLEKSGFKLIEDGADTCSFIRSD